MRLSSEGFSAADAARKRLIACIREYWRADLAALIAFLIRSYGNYPDGIAFAVLLMNVCAPLIDMKTQPPVFGHRGGPQS